MICFFFYRTRGPPRSTLPDTLFPYTTLFRSARLADWPAYITTQRRAPMTQPFRLTPVLAALGLTLGLAVTAGAQAQTIKIAVVGPTTGPVRSEEHTSELQSLMRISYAVFCLKKKTNSTK